MDVAGGLCGVKEGRGRGSGVFVVQNIENAPIWTVIGILNFV